MSMLDGPFEVSPARPTGCREVAHLVDEPCSPTCVMTPPKTPAKGSRPSVAVVLDALSVTKPALRVFVGRSCVSGREKMTLADARLWVGAAADLHRLNGAREDRTYLIVSEQQGLVEQITVPGAVSLGLTLAGA